ncbi:caspase-8-like isoform X2 [Anoplopoma fimbria]|uniref:caspase-8-like isoform X2 n=1 Tax=Anoplopoma fimbria TaxID=229290 RepID=UPI0023EB8501|nr:caspase-8-like isoform X2 [Anoplopoma fimbria]
MMTFLDGHGYILKPAYNYMSPPLDCEVCSSWRDSILANHTSPRGKVMWVNSKPDRWSQDKWEVAKVYMPDGHKKHNFIGDFDIAALLCLMNQCKHFKKFELGGLCDNVANVRNNIMHAARFQLNQEDLLDYFNRIRKLGEVLEKHVPEFKSLSEDINEIQSLDCKLILPDDVAAQNILDKDEKDLEDRLFAVAQEAAEPHLNRMKLEKLERQIAQQEQDNMPLTEYYALTHNPRGLCVVINNEDFHGNEWLKKRRGTQADEKALNKVFTSLGFTVVVHNNLTADDMRQELQQLGSRSFLDDDALVVCVLSHGELGCVIGADEKPVSLEELTRPFTSRGAPTLIGKPKLFFIQACQGSNYHSSYVPCPPMLRQEEGVRQSRLDEDAGPVHNMAPSAPPFDSDFLLGMATTQHYKTFRNTTTGTIYIQELCKQLTRSAKSSEMDDILAVLTRVNRQVSNGEYLRHKQIPEPKYTLTKKLVLKYVSADQDQVQS